MGRRPGNAATLSCCKRAAIPTTIPIPSVLNLVTFKAEHSARHSSRTASLCRRNLSQHQSRCDPRLPKAFPSFLSEIGQHIENGVWLVATRRCKIFSPRKIAFAEKQLAWPASKLCCVVSNAAMHPQGTRNLLLMSEQRFGTANLCVSSDPVPMSIRTRWRRVLI